MKKIFLILLAIAMTSCGGDDDTNHDHYLPTNDYQSSVTVDEQPYEPASGHYSIVAGDNENETGRSFVLSSGSDTPNVLQFRISYPTSMANATGSYIFHIGVIGENLFAQGTFTGLFAHNLVGGTVHVTDLGNHKFRFEFEHIEGLDWLNGSPDILIDGTFEGTLAFNGTAN